jgi:DNA-binding CsgD family transcriptional regulator
MAITGSDFSKKEWRMIKWVSRGLRNKDIAPLVGLSELSLKNYLRRIYDKVGVWSRLELALWYVRREDQLKREASNVTEYTEYADSHQSAVDAGMGDHAPEWLHDVVGHRGPEHHHAARPGDL